MRNKKEFDCIEFKQELFEKAWKKSGAKNLREYVEYVNKHARKSTLFNKQRKANVEV